jgi:hypothetical protein
MLWPDPSKAPAKVRRLSEVLFPKCLYASLRDLLSMNPIPFWFQSSPVVVVVIFNSSVKVFFLALRIELWRVESVPASDECSEPSAFMVLP